MKTHVLVSTILTLAALSPIHAATLPPEKGRAILQAHQDSILPFTASISVSASAGGRSMPAREQMVRGVGTVISEDGLIVTALSTLNPSSMLSGQKINTPSGKVDLNVSAEIKELKIIMPDGLEIPANLVMKDNDLDLAFYRPKAGSEEVKDVKFHAIELSESGPAEILDEVLLLNRLSKTFSYQPSGGISEVMAKIEKPRLLYRVMGATAGTPVYTADGKLLGLAANRKPLGEDSGENPAMRLVDTLVVLPAADVAKIAAQAAKAQPQEDDADKESAKPETKDTKPATKASESTKPESKPAESEEKK